MTIEQDAQAVEQKVQAATSGLDLRTKLEVAIVIIFGAVLWYVATPAPAPVNQWQPAQAAPELAKVGTEKTKPVAVVVYKQPAKKKLGLPAAIQDNHDDHVQTATALPINDHPTELVTILNEQTGKTEVVVENKPLPWFAAENHGSVGIGYGLTSGLMRGWAINAHEDLLQIKAFHFGVDGAAFTGGTYFVGVGVAYHW